MINRTLSLKSAFHARAFNDTLCCVPITKLFADEEYERHRIPLFIALSYSVQVSEVAQFSIKTESCSFKPRLYIYIQIL